MSGVRIGEAFIEVKADSDKAFSKLSNDAINAGNVGGSGLAKGILSGLDTIGKGVLGTGALITGVLTGGALKGGFDRLMNIDEAQFKLKGLGYTTQEVEGIMENSLNSVKGTAYGLEEAVTVASGALAAGVKPGKDLERTLGNVGDAAAIAGVPFNEMGQIFNKTAATGKLTTESMQQIQERGIPILQYLADMYGVSNEEAQKMVSEGKVSFADFEKAMETNLGGAALTMGESFKGGFANMKAALSRIGATVLEPFFKLLGTAFKAITPIFDAINGALKPAMEQIGAMMEPLGPKIEAFAAGFAEKIGPAIAKAMEHLPGLVKAFMDMAPAIGIVTGVVAAAGTAVTLLTPIFTMLAPVIDGVLKHFGGMSGVVSKLGGALKLLGGPIGLIAGALIYAYATSEPFRNAINSLIGTVMELVGSLATALMPIFNLLTSTVFPAITAVINALIPVFTQIVTAVASVVSQLADALVPVITTIVSTVVPALTEVLNTILPVLMDIINNGIMPFVTFITGTLIPILVDTLMPIVKIVFDTIANVIKAAMEVVKGVINVVMGVISGDWSQVWEGIKQVFSGVWNAIKSIVEGALNIVKSIVMGGVNGIKSFFSDGFNALKGIASGAWENVKGAVRSGVDGAVDLVRSLPGKARDALGNLGSMLVNSGAALIQGFKDGITNAFGSVKDVVTGGLQRIRDLFPFSPAKEGPFSGKGYTSFSGKALATDFAKGIASRKDEVSKATESLMGMAQSALGGDLKLSANARVSGAQINSGTSNSRDIIPNNTTVTNNYYVNIDAKNVKELNTVIDMINNVSQVARAGRGSTASARIA